MAYLLHAGADKEILTKKGERPAQLTSKREIRKMLGGKPIGYVIRSSKTVVKGCLKHVCSNLYFAREDTVFGFW